MNTGEIGADGLEVVLREYLCDVPDCGNVAEYLLGVVVELGAVAIVCAAHAPGSQASGAER